MPEEFEEIIRSKIHHTTKRATKKIPKFKCGFTSPFMFSQETRYTTKTYDIQCQQKDAAELMSLLEKTFISNQSISFVLHKIRHKEPLLYRNAIRQQNSFLNKFRVIPIQGISREIMFRLEAELLRIPGVNQVHKHKLTPQTGRYSVTTTTEHFKKVKDIIRTDLNSRVAHYANEFPLDGTLGPVGLAFKNQGFDTDSSSNSSFQSYLTACSSIFANEEEGLDTPPESDRAAQQVWGGSNTIPLPFDTSTPITVNSTVTSEEYEKAQKLNQEFSKQIAVLQAQVAELQKGNREPKISSLQESPSITTISTGNTTAGISSHLFEELVEKVMLVLLDRMGTRGIHTGTSVGQKRSLDTNIDSSLNMSIDSAQTNQTGENEY